MILGAMEPRRHRAGERITDLCRACHIERDHTVIVVDGDGRVIRAQCDFCGSQHNYRGGGDQGARRERPDHASATLARLAPAPAPLVSERERTGPRMTTGEHGDDLEMMLRRVLREEMGLTAAAPAEKWRGGLLVLRPGKPGLQEKSWPIESFFHKIVMIRNRLRNLEQQVNASDLSEDAKVKLQSYVTGCYGSLTSFNVLFADEADQFRGGGGGE
jgi:hypothetical protein